MFCCIVLEYIVAYSTNYPTWNLSIHHRLHVGKWLVTSVLPAALSKTCRDDAGTVKHAETPGQPLVSVSRFIYVSV